MCSVACACVVVTGLCYIVCQQLSHYYSKTRLHDTSKVLVQFNVGFYIITSAGAVSIIGVACTLMRRVRASTGRRGCLTTDRRQLDSDIERLTNVVSASCPPAGHTPPPYQR